MGSLKVNISSDESTAAFQVDSTTQGALVPRMTEAQRDAIGTPATSLLIFNTTTGAYNFYSGAAWVSLSREVFLYRQVGDETTALTTGTAKLTFRMPFAMTLTAVRASVTTAPTDATLIVDINEGGTSVLSTKLTIDATEKTSTTAAAPAVISDSALADDAEMTIDIDQIGSTIAGAGLKVCLIGYR